MKTKLVHINTIKAGDTVVHNGEVVTVCQSNIKEDSFTGRSIFGDCYRSGYKLVELVMY